MKRFLSLLLCSVLILGMFVNVFAEELEEPVEVFVTTSSNRFDTKVIAGVYHDEVFYVDARTIADLTGAFVMQDTDELLEFALHNGLRIIQVTDQDEVTEQQVKMSFKTTMPTLLYEDKLYVSAPHLLRYMGATVGFGEDQFSSVHMMVSMPYTVLDLFSDFSGYNGYLFSWAEAEGKWVNPGDITALAALDTILLGYDSNFLAYAIPGHSNYVEKTIHADALLEILRNEGTELLKGTDLVPELIGISTGTTQLSSTFIGEVMGWIDDPGFSKVLSDTMSISMDGVGIMMDISADYAKSLETARQFANMTGTQKNLLNQTMNRVYKHSALYEQTPLLFDAAKESSALIGNEYAANEKAQWDLIYSLMTNAANAVVSKFNPVSFAWDAMCGIVQLDPLLSSIVEAETNIVFAEDCESVMNIGISLLCDDAEKYNLNNAYMTDKEAGNQELLKADMILVLKSVLAARLLLLDTGWLTEGAENLMNIKVEGTAKLLNKAQNAKPTPIGIMPKCEEDISWIQYLTAQGDFGHVVRSRGSVYYWRYYSASFEETGFSGFAMRSVDHYLYRMDEDGSSKRIINLDGGGKFAIANGQIFYHNHDGTVRSIFMDGSGEKNWGKGTLQGVTQNGSHVIYTDDNGDMRAIDPLAGSDKLLARDGRYITCREDVIYYSLSNYDEAAQKGRLSLYSILPTGKKNTHLYTTQPDLYSSGVAMSSADVAQIRFNEDYIYFSYGSIAGSGIFYQGGKVARVRYDGTDGQVVGGQSELVGPQFVVNGDGSVTCEMELYSQPLFVNRDPVLTENGVLYLYDPESGAPVPYLYPADYSVLGGTKLGIVENGRLASVHFAQVIDGKLYCVLHLGKEDPENNFGWRNAYSREKTAFLVKDLQSGSVNVVFDFS